MTAGIPRPGPTTTRQPRRERPAKRGVGISRNNQLQVIHAVRRNRACEINSLCLLSETYRETLSYFILYLISPAM